MLEAILFGAMTIGTLGGPGTDGLVGSWTCTSASLSHGTWVFTRPSATELALRGEVDENFRLNRATHRWTWTSKSLGATAYAGPWNSDDSWTFDGAMRGAGTPRSERIRMILTNLTSNAFHREIDVVQGDQLFQTSASACSRIP